MEKIETQNAPKALGPYSQAIKVWSFVFCSGQIAFDTKTMKLVDWWIEEQTHQICKNITNVLKAADLTLENVVKTTIFLTNMEDFSLVNKIYWDYFSHKPARSTVEVSKLPLGANIEIEAIASE